MSDPKRRMTPAKKSENDVPQYVMEEDRCWLSVGSYDLFIVKDGMYGGLRIECYRDGVLVDGAYGNDNTPIPPSHPRLRR